MNTEKDIGFINETIERLSDIRKLSVELLRQYPIAYERIQRLEGLYYSAKEKSPIKANLLEKPQKELEIVIQKLTAYKERVKALKGKK